MTSPPPSPKPRDLFQPTWLAFWCGLTLRLAFVLLGHQFRIRTLQDHFGFGWEMGRIARSLATGHGYANPFDGDTGPTAWVTPAYPLLIAAVFKLTGVYTLTSAFLLQSINCLFNAFVIRTTYEIAARSFNRSIALWSMWLWALYPAAAQFAVKWIWEMSLTGFLLSCILVLALRMARIGDPATSTNPGPTTPRWLLFGLLWGLVALSNPALLLFLPACGLWVLSTTPRWPSQVPRVLLATLVFLACIAPWTYRNYRAFHQFIPMRANFGAELYMGNGPNAIGIPEEDEHPMQDPTQLRLYSQMGEVAYSKMRGAQAAALIHARPLHFADLCLRRLQYFWFSVPHAQEKHAWIAYGRALNDAFPSLAALLGLALALHRRIPAAWLYFWAFLLLPFSYYFVTVQARFRHPFEPLVLILSVYLFQSADKSRPFSFSPSKPNNP